MTRNENYDKLNNAVLFTVYLLLSNGIYKKLIF